MRYKAPDHVTEANLTAGPAKVIDGHITIDGDVSPGDHIGLLANGFTPVADAPAAAEPLKGSKA